MKGQSTLLNLFGQIRVYSLLDLILFSLALHTNHYQIAGIILLHLGFLLFLEFSHKHEFRVAFPKYLWCILLILGIIYYQNIAVVGFLLCSYFYVKKNSLTFGWSGPFFRGLQYYFLAAGIIGFLNPVSFIAAGLLIVRNFAGDLRDIIKDRKEGYRTLPIIIGLKKDVKYVHLIAILGTTFFWWYLSGITALWLIPIFVVQVGLYNLTPR
jgi:1,4-dihydroxy-2-naphthoate octaprenyltransferase